jgi:hypothetical protein
VELQNQLLKTRLDAHGEILKVMERNQEAILTAAINKVIADINRQASPVHDFTPEEVVRQTIIPSLPIPTPTLPPPASPPTAVLGKRTRWEVDSDDASDDSIFGRKETKRRAKGKAHETGAGDFTRWMTVPPTTGAGSTDVQEGPSYYRRNANRLGETPVGPFPFRAVPTAAAPVTTTLTRDYQRAASEDDLPPFIEPLEAEVDEAPVPTPTPASFSNLPYNRNLRSPARHYHSSDEDEELTPKSRHAALPPSASGSTSQHRAP